MRLSIQYLLAIACVTSVIASQALSYCKCACGKYSSILELSEPSNPAKPCLDCTRQFCLEHAADLCLKTVATEDEMMVAECFQRESLKDEIIVIVFLMLTVGLLVYSTIIKSFLEKRRGDSGREYDSLSPEGSNR